MKPRASVVVPTYGRPELLHRCLEALVRQDFDGRAFEILVVDNAGRDDTRQVVAHWAACVPAYGPKVRYLRATKRSGPAAARNVGWKAARGEIVVFTDDDCIAEPDWLQNGVAALVDGIAGVSGHIFVPLDRLPTDYERNAAQLAHSEFVTANCFYRRDALESVGGFDERFRVAWREDTDLYFRLLEHGCMLVHAPDAVVAHPIRRAHWGVSLRQQRKSAFNALLYRKHPALYRARIQASPPWRYYAIVTALLGASAAASRGYRPLALGLAAIWALLTGQFCRRRLRGTSHAPTHVLEMIVTSALIPPVCAFWRIYGAVKFRVFFL